MIFANTISLHAYGKDLLHDVSFSIESDSRRKIAVVGYNGVGKSTFLKMIAGLVEPHAGNFSTKGEIIGYLPQDQGLPSEGIVLEYLESLLAEPWMTYQIDMLADQWNISEDLLLRNMETLSGGERIRIAMMSIMLQEPTVLLLDEPTNHLDQEAMNWLAGVIADFKGHIFVISHDRHFISTYMNEIWEIGLDASLTRFQGNYGDFIAEKERLYEKRVREYEACRKEVDDLVLWLKIHEFHPKYQFSDRVLSRKKALENARRNLPPKPVVASELKLSLPDAKEYPGRVCKVQIAEFGFDETVLFSNIDFSIHKSERVQLTGPNGSGKSTLLKLVHKAASHPTDGIELKEGVRIGYLSQYSVLPDTMTLLEAMEHFVPGIGNRARNVLAYYRFPDDEVFKKVGDVSLGERKRVELAIMLCNKPDFLLLDEPTNHMDIYAREDIERFLMPLSIPMLIISHDEYFIEKMKCTKVVKMCK